MKYIRSLVSFLLLLGVAIPPVPAAEQKIKYTGTFTSLEYHREGGDLVGEEIKIVLARKGHQGALQIAEGESGELMLVDIIVKKDRMSFEIPAAYPLYGGGTFEGRIDAKGIRGVLRFKSGAENAVRWIRGRSYWEK
jgi:hypothetical protein